MSHRYMIRIYEDANNAGATTPGTTVRPVARELSIYADTADEAEKRIRSDVEKGALPAGRVYQICPWLANAELIRSVAASLDGSFERMFLDPVSLYSEMRRLRYPRPPVTGDESLTRLNEALRQRQASSFAGFERESLFVDDNWVDGQEVTAKEA